MSDSIWTLDSLAEYMKSAFAHRDEVQRIAHEAASTVDEKLEKLRALAEEIRPNLMTRSEYERRHADLQREARSLIEDNRRESDRRHEQLAALHREDIDRLERIIGELANWRANLTGRMVGLGIVGAVIVAAVSAIVTHLVAGA